jgi:hypothetical protein
MEPWSRVIPLYQGKTGITDVRGMLMAEGPAGALEEGRAALDFDFYAKVSIHDFHTKGGAYRHFWVGYRLWKVKQVSSTHGSARRPRTFVSGSGRNWLGGEVCGVVV